MKQPACYILASKPHGTLYVGVTSGLARRVHEHREGVTGGFASRYRCEFLMFYEMHETMLGAIAREKQIKSWSRAKKVGLIEAANPGWRDLYGDVP